MAEALPNERENDRDEGPGTQPAGYAELAELSDDTMSTMRPMATQAVFRPNFDDDDDDDEARVAGKNVGVLTVAAVTFANGGDNIGVYVPVFLSVRPAAVVAYCLVFLALVAVLVLTAKFVATRQPIAEVLERWEHVLFPVVLIGLGIFILVSGLAFGD